MEQRYFTANHKNKDVIKKSSSGGMFTAITDEWLDAYKENAVVYGCVLDENLNAVHKRATTREERNAMRGSKYISSDISGTYNNVINDIKEDKHVLFSGTPCQIAGLKAFLNASDIKTCDNLLTFEIVCHGVGSNRFFADYISHLEKKYKSKAVSCNFRAKSRQGKSEDMEVLFENGKRYNAATTRYDWFYSAYISNYILRPSCYECKFAKPEREADICVSDNWNEFYSESPTRHLSAVIVTTQKGLEWFEKSSKNLDFAEKTLDGIYQMNLYEPSKKPERYDEFQSLYNSENGYLKAQKFLGNHTVKGYIRSFAVDMLYRLDLIDKAKKVLKRLKAILRK